MAASVQFSGVQNVLEAFNNRGLDYWSIFQGKQFLFKGLAPDLETVLEALKEGGSTSVYTLKVYEGVSDLSEIKSKTEDSGSFNFRLSVDESYNDRSLSGGMFGLLDTRMKSLEDKIDSLSNDDSEIESTIEAPEKTAIGEIMGNPAVAALIPILVERLIDYFVPKKNMENKTTVKEIDQPLRAVSGVPVIDLLKEYDKDIETHLFKLLTIAKTNKPFFDALINSLNSMEV